VGSSEIIAWTLEVLSIVASKQLTPTPPVGACSRWLIASRRSLDLPKTLQAIQAGMLETARKKLSDNTETVTTLDHFKQAFNRKDKLNMFVLAPFIDDEKVEKAINELGVTVRCIPLAQPKVAATCLFTGQPTQYWALYAKSY
jgi:prolyl-tRNA synthetase